MRESEKKPDLKDRVRQARRLATAVPEALGEKPVHPQVLQGLCLMLEALLVDEPEEA